MEPTEAPNTPSDVQSRIDELEAKLKSLEQTSIAQEHRFTALLTNLYKYFVHTPENETEEDLRKKQLATVSSAGTWILKYARRRLWILGGGGIIAVLTLLIGFFTLREFQKQNQEFAKQNAVIIEQNNHFRQQNLQAIRSANSSANASLISDIEAEYKQALENEGLNPDSSWTLPHTLRYKINTISMALEPYEMSILDDYPVLINGVPSNLFSPERGFLLGTLVDMDVVFPLYPRGWFTSAYLNGADFSEANLAEISLDRASLQEVSFENAYLPSASFISANLEGAFLSYAYLGDAQFEKANLTSAYLDYASLPRTNFIEADLTAADLYATILASASLINANLTYANLKHADLTYADLQGADLTGAELMNADLYHANVSSAIFTNTRIDTHYTDVMIAKNLFNDSLVSFVSYALANGAIAVDSSGTPLPPSLQQPAFYE